MKLISFGNIDKKIISILLGCLSIFISRAINYISLFKESKLWNQPILINIYIAFSKLFTIIPFIIYKKRVNIIKDKKNDSSNNSKKNIKLIYKDYYNDNIRGRWKYLILTSLIFFIQSFILIETLEIKSNTWILDILITSILCYLIFKIKLYKHHYMSIIIIILIGFIIDIVLGNLQQDITENILYLLLRFLREILYSLHDVIVKYIIEKKYCSIYEISLSNGIINIILLIIFAIINYYFLNIENFNDYFNNYNIKELFVGIILMIVQLILFLCTLYTNKNYTPCHIFIIFVFGQLALYMDFSKNSIIVIICLIFILFFSLIFNEIIEINIFGFSYNTKKNIMMRAETDDFYTDITDSITDDSINDNEERRIELN